MSQLILGVKRINVRIGNNVIYNKGCTDGDKVKAFVMAKWCVVYGTLLSARPTTWRPKNLNRTNLGCLAVYIKELSHGNITFDASLAFSKVCPNNISMECSKEWNAFHSPFGKRRSVGKDVKNILKMRRIKNWLWRDQKFGTSGRENWAKQQSWEWYYKWNGT